MSVLGLPAVYPITDTRISGLSHLEQVKRLVEGGATFIQLREKGASAREFYAAAVECIAYARPHGVRIVINDRVDIALAAGADGVHLGQEDMPPAAAREVLGASAVIGFSTHSVEQAVEAASMPADYIAIGPVFATKTKDDPDPVVGLEGVAKVARAIGSIPLVAIGGIGEGDLSDVIGAGAASAAMISSILGNSDVIAEAFKRLSYTIRSHTR